MPYAPKWEQQERRERERERFVRGTLISIRQYDALLRTLVGIATGYGLDDQGVGIRVPVGSKIFTSPYRTDRLWGPPNLL
jgi:hypothetical protein